MNLSRPNQPHLRIVATLAVLLLGLGALAACGTNEESQGKGDGENGSKVVKFAGIAGGLSSFIANVIVERGLDEKNGLKLEITELSSVEVNRSLAAGRVDAAILGAPAMLLMHKQIPDIRALRPLYDVNHIYLAKSGSGISGPEDLKGKTVTSIGTTSGGHVAMQLIFDDLGMDFTRDTKIIEADVPVGLAALEEGAADAAVAWAPTASRLLESGDYEVALDIAKYWKEKNGTPISSGVVGVSQKWIDADKDRAQKLSTTFGQAIDQILQDSEIYENAKLREIFGIEKGQSIEAVKDLIAPILTVEWGASDAEAQSKILERTSKLNDFPAVDKADIDAIWEPTVTYFD